MRLSIVFFFLFSIAVCSFGFALDVFGVDRLKKSEYLIFRDIPLGAIDKLVEQATGNALRKAIKVKNKKIASIIKTYFLSGYKTFAPLYYENYDVFGDFGFYEVKDRQTYFHLTPLSEIHPDFWGAFAYWYGIQKQYAGKSIMLDDIPSHTRQLFRLSCEANTLRDFINFYYQKRNRKLVTEREILDKIPFDPTPFRTDGVTNWRGDPDVGFVGDVNGISFRLDKKHTHKWGYGVYPQPLTSILDAYVEPFGLYSYVTYELSQRVLIESLVAGNPVMFWYTLEDTDVLLPVITPSGEEKVFVRGQHVGLIVGADLDTTMNVTHIYFYEGLSKEKQKMTYDEFVLKTRLLNRYLLVR